MGNIITIICLSEINGQAKQPIVTEGKQCRTHSKGKGGQHRAEGTGKADDDC